MVMVQRHQPAAAAAAVTATGCRTASMALLQPPAVAAVVWISTGCQQQRPKTRYAANTKDVRRAVVKVLGVYCLLFAGLQQCAAMHRPNLWGAGSLPWVGPPASHGGRSPQALSSLSCCTLQCCPAIPRCYFSSYYLSCPVFVSPCLPAPPQTITWLESQGIGKRQVNYKLRDWLFARQRYWGEPFPLLYPGAGFRVQAQVCIVYVTRVVRCLCSATGGNPPHCCTQVWP